MCSDGLVQPPTRYCNGLESKADFFFVVQVPSGILNRGVLGVTPLKGLDEESVGTSNTLDVKGESRINGL